MTKRAGIGGHWHVRMSSTYAVNVAEHLESNGLCCFHLSLQGLIEDMLQPKCNSANGKLFWQNNRPQLTIVHVMARKG